MNNRSCMLIFDIETILKNRTHVANLIGFLSKKQLIFFHSENCIEKFIDYLLVKQKKSKVIHCYSHNFSGFDSFFIIPTLLKKK